MQSEIPVSGQRKDVARFRKSLERLQLEFQGLRSCHAAVAVRMIHVDGVHEEGAIKFRNERLPGVALNKYGGLPIDLTGSGSYARRGIAFTGDCAAIDVFKRLTSSAGTVIRSGPIAALELVEQDTLDVHDSTSLWVFTLFDLGWKSLPGNPLVSGKAISDGDVEYPYDLEMIRASAEMFKISSTSGANSPTLQERVIKDGLPGWYYSDIDDVCAASVYAIDILLEEVNRLPHEHREDALWRALDDIGSVLEQQPTVIRELPITDPDGLKSDHINELARQHGLIRAGLDLIGERRWTQNSSERRFVTVLNGRSGRLHAFNVDAVPPALWAPTLLQFLRLWQDRRGQQLEGRRDLIPPICGANAEVTSEAKPVDEPGGPAIPAGTPERRPNDREQKIIDELFERGFTSLEVLLKSPNHERPTQQRLAGWLGMPCDGHLKGALSRMVFATWLGNAAHHKEKRGSGYYLRAAGNALATGQSAQS